MAHIAPLLFSSLAYFAAFFILGDKGTDTGTGVPGPSQAVEIAKLVLWYLPIILEIISHFVAISLSGFVKYPRKLVHERSGTVFLIMYVYFPSALSVMMMNHTVLGLAWTKLPPVSKPSSGMRVWVVVGFHFLFRQLSYSSASLRCTMEHLRVRDKLGMDACWRGSFRSSSSWLL